MSVTRRVCKLSHDLAGKRFGTWGEGISHQTDRSKAAAEERESLLYAIVGKATGVMLTHQIVGERTKQTISCGNVSVMPLMRKADPRAPASCPPLALLAGTKIQLDLLTHRQELKN